MDTTKTIKNISVYGIFKTRVGVENAIDALKLAGFRNADVSALLPAGDTNKEFAHEKATKAPEGATTGAATGMVLGGVLGWLAGVGSLAIPGVGPLIAAGPLMGLLAGAGIGGAAGTITGGLIGMGIPEYEAKRYEGQIRDGGILLSIHCDDKEWRDLAERILKDAGANDISSSTEAKADYAKTARPVPMTRAAIE